MRGGIKQPSLNGIDPRSGQILFEQTNTLYKIDPSLHTDILVAMVRANLLINPPTEDVSRVILSLLPIQSKSGFNCQKFYSLLSPSEHQLVDERMKDVPFVCIDKNCSIEIVLKSYPDALNPQIIKHNTADCYWAWFSTTGDSEPLKRILDNYVSNPNACIDCIEWSFPSQAKENPDVLAFFEDYSRTQSSEVRAKLERLRPK